MIENVTVKKSVMYVASECNPFVGTGGLADVAGSLPKALQKTGEYDVRVVLPLYKTTDEKLRRQFRFIGNINVPLGWRNQYCGVFSYFSEGVLYYFIDNEYYFKRDKLYGEYDDGERFAFFSKACLEIMPLIDFYPHILHCNDWQTALAPIYLKTLFYGKYKYKDIRAVFTIHNIEYQGKYGEECLGDLFGLPDYTKNMLEFDGCLNLMKGAMEVSDRVTTVSPTYAREILDAYFAHGLESVTNRNAFKLSGILNGIDEDYYNPKTDGKIFANYTKTSPAKKAENKKGLQEMLGLPVKDYAPVISMISRLVKHKGLDLVTCVIEELLHEDVQFVVLGTGDAVYESFFRYLAERYSGKMRFIAAFNKDLAAKIYAGSDIFLMPSKQEPCGLSQMIACRYGTIPVVRKTGGLADSIIPVTESNGIGYVFDNFNAHEMLFALKKAADDYKNKTLWQKYVKRAMGADFSWASSALEYEKLYDEIL
ncbi:MAG: glycogen synthase GlgA [Christensenellaceae bacterium]|nr:glycogen synthase GlgA [Christensenellaceae bacterium]MDD6926327.1 glycogen synthase GlgA [bacterium]MDY2851261.1 glycogen synthase GlgA [Christensenellaceae bacterium]